MGKRGPSKGSKYNINKSCMKASLNINVTTDLKAFIRKRAREEHISESLLMDNIIRRDMLGQKNFLIWKYKEALAEAEKWQHLISLYKINNVKVELEDDIRQKT